jgi:SAM-dependent methyltransferase
VAPGQRVLDLCCGPGYVAQAAQRRSALPTGLDFSAAMVTLARSRAPSLEFREGDAGALPFADGTFDAVVMGFGLHHMERPEAVAAEIARVLRPGGRFAFTVWGPLRDSVGHALVLAAIGAHGTHEVGLPPGPPIFRFADEGESGRLLAGAGFTNAAARVLPLTWQIPAKIGLTQAIREGAVRLALVLDAQTPKARKLIEESVARETERFRNGETLHVPMSAVLGWAQR